MHGELSNVKGCNMKQRINIEQLQELTEEQKQRLREWWKPNKYDVAIDFKYDNYEFPVEQVCDDKLIDFVDYGEEIADSKKEDCLPLLNIGQMIELLTNKGRFAEKLIIEIYKATRVERENKICEIYEHSRDYEDGIVSYANRELANCLWQAVKQVL
jgi:hypothetical protein